MQKEGVSDVKRYAILRSGSSRASRGSQRRPDFVVSRNQPGKHWTAAGVPVGLGATSVRAHIASESVPDRKNLDIIPAPNLSCYIVAHSDQDHCSWIPKTIDQRPTSYTGQGKMCKCETR